MNFKLSLLIVLMVAFASRTSAQMQYPPETKNAALRYWIAFAEMKDVPADKATQDLLEQTLSAEALWDEKKIAPILDANKFAIDIMQRATKLPDCDWGHRVHTGSECFDRICSAGTRLVAFEYARRHAATCRR